MPKKSRDPNNFNYTDYISWYLEIIDVRERFIASGEWPMHLDTDFVTLRNELIDADTDYEGKLQHLVKTATPLHESTSLKVFKRIVSFKRLLPTLFDGDETVLTEFAINKEIPVDRDDLFIMAKNCLDHWNELCDPAMPPVYAPVAGFFTEYATEFSDFEAAHEAHIDATREKEIAETLVDTKRDACHKAERLVFTWFRGIHIDPEEKWWEDTPWGTSSGGEGVTGWKKAPVATMTLAKPPLDGILAGCEKYKGTDRFDIRIAFAKKNEPPPSMPGVDTYTDVEQPVLLDADGFPLEKNFVYYLWISARKDGETSPWSDAASIEWTE